MPSKIDDVYCRDCGEEEIYIDLKPELSLYKVGAVCDDCHREYGVVQRLPRAAIDHYDEAWDQAEAFIRRYMD